MMNDLTLQDKIAMGFMTQFNLKGPKLTIEDVAVSLHIAKKTIYTVFDSKKSIYEYILAKTSDEINTHKLAIINDKKMTTKEKLMKFLTIKTTAESTFDVSKLSEVAKYEPEFYVELLASYSKEWESFKLLVEMGKKDGTLKPDTSADFLIDLLTHGYAMFYENDFLKKNHLTYTEAVRKLAELVLSGVYTK